LKKFFLFFILVFSGYSQAGWQSGKIAKLLVHDNGAGSEKYDVRLEQTGSGSMIWCNTSKEWTALINNEASKMQFSMLLAAYMSGKSVQIDSDGSKDCPDGSRNRVRNVRFEQ